MQVLGLRCQVSDLRYNMRGPVGIFKAVA